MTEICIKCGTKLTEDNWYPSVAKRNYHLCKKCYNKSTEKYNLTKRELDDIESITSFDKIFGGYTIRILNHASFGYPKYQITPTNGPDFMTTSLVKFKKRLLDIIKDLEENQIGS